MKDRTDRIEEFFKQLLEALPYQRYDIVSKGIFAVFAEALLRHFTNIRNLEFIEHLDTELPTVEIRRMDILAKVRINGKEVLVHIEFQVSSQPETEIVKRKVGYIGRCYEKYGLPILSHTVYMIEGAGDNDPGKYTQEFNGYNIDIEYQVIHLSKFDGQAVLETREPSLIAFTPLMKRPDDVSAVEWVERCHEQVRTLDLDPDVQNNLLLWQWILSGLIVDPEEIKHLMEVPMFESSTYRYIFEQGQQEIAVENILSFLDARFGIGTDETLQIALEQIEDIQRLKALVRTAAQVDTLEAFRQKLTENGK